MHHHSPTYTPSPAPCRGLFPFLFAAHPLRASAAFFSSSIPASLHSASLLSPHRDHILVCGFNDAIGLLLRALQTPPPLPPKTRLRGALAALSSLVSTAAEKGDSGPARAAAASARAHAPIVILVPVTDRLSDDALNAMHGGSSKALSKVSWVNGSPLNMGAVFFL
jgi:hypothetical protein